jgi:hypothetical protein
VVVAANASIFSFNAFLMLGVAIVCVAHIYSQQRTLACCPPPAQVFSRQLPNHMQFFFQILKI